MSDNPLSSANASSIVSRAKAIITDPKAEWPKIAVETKSVQDIFLTYALPLMLIGPICTLIGLQVFGFNAIIFTIRPGIGYSLTLAVSNLVMVVATLFAVSYIANFVSQQMGGKNDFTSAFKLVTYSYTPAWVLGVFMILWTVAPFLAILAMLLGLYGAYLFFLGVTPLMGIKDDKVGMYVAAIILAAIVVRYVASLIANQIAGNPMMNLAGSM